jgi:hypothetical protein
MKVFRFFPAGPAPYLAILLLLGGACTTPEFSSEEAFTRPLKEFARLEPRTLALELAKNTDLPRRDDWATAFSKDYREALLYRLHRRRFLDKMDGPLLVLEGRVLKYEWTVTPPTTETGEQAAGTIEVAFSFKDETGTRIGGGTVTANESGMDARTVMEKAGRSVVSSVYKFLRKQIGRPAQPEPAEPEVAP